MLLYNKSLLIVIYPDLSLLSTQITACDSFVVGELHELTLGFSLENTDYVVGYMEGECLPANMNREINQRHKEMREECLECVVDATVLYDLKREE